MREIRQEKRNLKEIWSKSEENKKGRNLMKNNEKLKV